MKNNMELYKAIGEADDVMVKDAIESRAEKAKNYELRNILEAVACVVIVCGFVVLSFVLQNISKPSNGNITASSRDETTATEMTVVETGAIVTNEETYIAVVTAAEDGSIKKWGQLDDNSVVIFNENAVSMINKIYGHPGTSDMKLKLNQIVTTDELEGYQRICLRDQSVQYYDPDYIVKPMYYSWDDENRLLTDEEIAQRTDKDYYRQNGAAEKDLDDNCDPDWYEGSPYIRYEVNKYGKEQRVVHVDILDENISICGLTVNSSLDEAENVLKAFGFEVNRDKMNFTYGYGTDREYIYAKADGFWIVFETSSEFKGVSRSAYPFVDYLNYKDNTVPAVIRMGMDYTYVSTDTHNDFSHTEQFDLL